MSVKKKSYDIICDYFQQQIANINVSIVEINENVALAEFFNHFYPPNPYRPMPLLI